MMIIDLVLNSKRSTALCYKAELTMDDLMTTKNKELFAKTKWITLFIANW